MLSAARLQLGACHIGRVALHDTRPACMHRKLPTPSVRSVQPVGAVSNSLIQVLKDELKYQKEEYRTPPELEEGPPEPFVLDEAPGKKVFSLSGKFGDEETIVVELNLEEQPGSAMEDDEEDAYEDELDDVSSVTFTVNIKKQGRTLAFECESDGDSVAINHLELLTEPDSEEDDVLPAYTGPVFDDLDDTLKQAFVDYLEERFITAELGAYLITLTADKSWNEYMQWLTKVKGFIAER